MVFDYKKLLANHGFKVAEQVANERLRRAGVTLGDLGVSIKKPAKKDRISPAVLKRMAGG